VIWGPKYKKLNKYKKTLLNSSIQEYRKGINDFNKSIELKINNAEAYFYKGYGFCQLNEFDSAIKDFASCYTLKEKSHSHLCLAAGLALAALLKFQKEDDESKKILEEIKPFEAILGDSANEVLKALNGEESEWEGDENKVEDATFKIILDMLKQEP
jgi:tetratricopeptide (TPR) repeat protein